MSTEQQPQSNEGSSNIDAASLIDEHVEEVSEGGNKVRHKGVYLLPNLFTTAEFGSGAVGINISAAFLIPREGTTI